MRTSTITMVNVLPTPVAVDIVLRGLAGEQMAMQTVEIAARGVLVQRIADVLSTAGVELPAIGSATLTPRTASALAAQMSISDTSRSGSDDIEEEFLMTDDIGMARYRAVAASSNRIPVVAIFNTGTEAQAAFLDCYSGDHRNTRSEITVGAGRLRLIAPCVSETAIEVNGVAELSRIRVARNGPFALSVSPQTRKNTLAAFTIGVQQAEGGPALSGIPFADASMLNSSSQVFPSVPSDQPSGVRFTVSGAAANFGDVPEQVVIKRFANGAQIPIQTVTIPPGAVTVLDLGTDKAGVDPGAALILEGTGHPGDVVGQFEAVSPSSELRMPLPWKDLQQTPNGGQHPWRIDPGYQSTLRLSNADPTRGNSVRVAVYSGNTAWLTSLKIDALSTVSVDIGEIVRMQQEDDKERRLPSDTLQGLVRWYTLSEPKIFGALIQTDTLHNVIKPFACYQTEIPCGVSLDNASLLVGQLETQSAIVQGCTALKGQCSASSCVGGGGACSDDLGGLSNYNWSVGNSSIVRLSSAPTDAYAQLYGVAPGSTFYRVIGTVSGCTERGEGSVIIIPCTFPTGDSTQFSSWDDSQGDPSVGNWTQTLIPASGSFDGESVTESSPYAGTDSCWASWSIYQPSVNVTGATWIVSGGRWFYDQVGYFPATVKYYQTQRAQRGLPFPCGFTVFQNLTIACPKGQSTVYKGPVVLKGIISGTGVSSGRDGQLVGRTYQP